MRIADFAAAKSSGQRITMLTCYDAWSASILVRTSVDALLVGDSAAMVVHGHPTTLPATVPMLAAHVRAVAAGLEAGALTSSERSRHASPKAVVADMPFLAVGASADRAFEAAAELMRAGAGAVKIESAATAVVETIERLVGAGVPVMGHLGYTPQSVHQRAGVVTGADATSAERLERDAEALERAGCFAIVLECVPGPISERITRERGIPTIGIGAGVACDGQVLVLHDMLGLTPEFRPRFLKRYAELAPQIERAAQEYCIEVREGRFPGPEHTFGLS